MSCRQFAVSKGYLERRWNSGNDTASSKSDIKPIYGLCICISCLRPGKYLLQVEKLGSQWIWRYLSSQIHIYKQTHTFDKTLLSWPRLFLCELHIYQKVPAKLLWKFQSKIKLTMKALLRSTRKYFLYGHLIWGTGISKWKTWNKLGILHILIYFMNSRFSHSEPS